VLDPRLSQAQERDPGQLELVGPSPIRFEGAAGLVPGEAVDLDDERRLRPVKVNQLPLDEHVAPGLGQARLPHQGEKRPLQL